MNLNGRWFPQIVYIGTVGIYIQYILHSFVLTFYPKCVCGGGGGCQFFVFRKTILSHLIFFRAVCYFLFGLNIFLLDYQQA